MNCPVCELPNKFGQTPVNTESADLDPKDGDIGVCDNCAAVFVYSGKSLRIAGKEDIKGVEDVVVKAQSLVYERLWDRRDLAWLKEQIELNRKIPS